MPTKTIKKPVKKERKVLAHGQWSLEPMEVIPAMFHHIKWSSVSVGQRVWLWSQHQGQPLAVGPHTVEDVDMRRLKNGRDQTFMHYPEDLLLPLPKYRQHFGLRPLETREVRLFLDAEDKVVGIGHYTGPRARRLTINLPVNSGPADDKLVGMKLADVEEWAK